MRQLTRELSIVPLTLSLTDDYGTEFTEFDELSSQFQDHVEDGTRPKSSFVAPLVEFHAVGNDGSTRIDGLSLFVNVGDKPCDKAGSSLVVHGYSGPYFNLKLTVRVAIPARQLATSGFRILARAGQPASEKVANPVERSSDSTGMAALLGFNDATDRCVGWDDNAFVVMEAVSGLIQVRVDQSLKQHAVASKDKRMSLCTLSLIVQIDRGYIAVQTACRHIHLPSRAPDAVQGRKRCRIIERPGLNNSTGQRLWDCAIAMCCWLERDPSILRESPSVKDTADACRPVERSRRPPLERRVHRVIELGAGCGLVSMAVSDLLSHPSSRNDDGGGEDSEVVATDVQSTVSSTLTENTETNSRSFPDIQIRVLDWGPVDQTRWHETDGDSTDRARLTILATDVLYNTSSHEALLETLCGLLQDECDRAFIAYKPRTDGDGDFFEMAKRAGLRVERVWEWGQMSIWLFQRVL